MITVDTNFPSGSGVFNCIDERGIIHLKLNNEFNSISHGFHFRIHVSDPHQGALMFSIDNAGESSFANGWPNYSPFQSVDGKNWERIAPGFFVNSVFIFTVEKYSSEFFLAWYVPYPLNLYRNWFEGIKYSKIFNIVENTEEPDCLYLGDVTKPAIVIVARQHPGESMASYVVEGLVNSIIENPQSVSNFVEHHSLVIFPLLNKSGVEKGYHRLNKNGLDVNRCWHIKNVEEIDFVKRRLSLFSKIAAIFDIHGDEVSNINYVFSYPNKKDSLQFTILKTLGNLMPKITSLPFQPFFKRFVKNLLKRRQIANPGLTLAQFGRKEYKANTFTVEISAKSATESDCRVIGANLFLAIL